jgi:hypothetical protein
VKRFVLGVGGLAAFVAALWLGWTFRSGNSGVVDVDLIWVVLTSVELWEVIVCAIALGGGLASVLVGFAWLRARLLNRRYRSTIRRLEAELHQMRSLPLSGSSGTGLVEAAPPAVSGRS